MNDYPYGLNDFQIALEGTGRRVKRSNGSLITNCIAHQERNPSMQVFGDGWSVCYAGCGRFHISNYFPELKDPNWKPEPKYHAMPVPVSVPTESKADDKQYKSYDLFPEWEKMTLIPRDHTFKTIPLEILDELGWRWTNGVAGMGAGYFIPYFNADRTKIPFAQVRHLSGERRFTFLPEAKQTMYGKWNISDSGVLFVVEGPSDGAVLDYAMMPWVAVPSASCGRMLVELGKYCQAHGTMLVYAGDNDEAGEKLLDQIRHEFPFRVRQVPKKYKDWGDFLVAEGIEAVVKHCRPELGYLDPNMVAASDVFGSESAQTTLV